MAEITGKDIVSRIDAVLKQKNLKRKAVAEAVGISLQPFTSWANRGSIPVADTAYYIAKYLNVSLDWLLTGEDNTQPPQMQFTSQNDIPSEIISLAEDIFRLPSEYQEIIKNNVEAYKSLCYKLEKASTQNIG